MELQNYVKAGYPAIILTTPEEDRALDECKRIAKDFKLEFYSWSLTEGLTSWSFFERENAWNSRPFDSNMKDPIAALETGLKNLPHNGRGRIYCLLDFHPFIKSSNTWRRAKDLFKEAKKIGITYVFISIKFEIPPELEREVIVTSLPLPTREEIYNELADMSQKNHVPLPENPNNIVEAALGLTLNETENAFATTIAKYSRFDAKLISQVKEQIICHGGLLEYKSSDETLDSIGGLENFTSWAMKRLSAYSPEARQYGLPYPRGVLLIGIPGCGKSLTAKALANMWQKPLLRLDIGKLFGSLVGDTEANTRRALETAEAMSPAILWIDEVEKGLSGIHSSGKTDSGVTSRMFGTILTWLQEKKAPVFVIATANSISELPPEFLRKGRFDEVFFVDLPDLNERKAIFRIQFTKHHRNPDDFDLDVLAKLTDGYTGAEIEEAIISSMFTAWNDGQREPSNDDVIGAIDSINPMSKGMMSNQVDALRSWCTTSGISKANGTTTAAKTTNIGNETTRVIRQD